MIETVLVITERLFLFLVALPILLVLVPIGIMVAILRPAKYDLK